MTIISPNRAAGPHVAWPVPGQDPMLLTPGVVVATDSFGWEVASRVGALLRSLIRGPNQHFARALRDRFRFVNLVPGAGLVYSQVQSVAVDPTERLWSLDGGDWRYNTFTTAETGPFIATLQRTLMGDPARGMRGVLAYAEDEELLRAHGLLIQPGRLNVFFVGSLIPELQISDVELEQILDHTRLSQGQALASPLDRPVGEALERLRDVAERVRDLARNSHSLDLVVRGAFLSLALPVDNYTFARLSLGAHGSTLGKLLTPPPPTEYPTLIGYEEPPLHFSSLYGQHDERGAAYDQSQIADMMGNAICALLLSELADSEACAAQLGLRSPYAKTYERLVTISAIRSSSVKAELIDYAAFHYGAQLIDALLPAAMTGAPTAADRARLQPEAARLLDIAGLAALAVPEDPLRQDGTRLPAIAGSDEAIPPDLNDLVPEPRFGALHWERYAAGSLDQLERLSELADTLAATAGAGAAGLPTQRPEGTAFSKGELDLLSAWREWCETIEQRLQQADAGGEVRRRLIALTGELDRRLWDAPPAGTAVSGARYGWLLVELALEQVQRVGQALTRGGGPEGPSPAESAAELDKARRRSRARMGLAPVVAMSVLLLILGVYLLIGVRSSARVGWLADLAALPPRVWSLSGGLALTVRSEIVLAGLLALAALCLGLVIRQIQTFRATLAIRTYARLVRRRFAAGLSRAERAYGQTLLGELRDYLAFLQLYLRSLHADAQQIAQTYRERAIKIGDAQPRCDVAEYSPVTAESPAELYRTEIAPRVPEMLRADMPLLQREATRIWGFAEGLQPSLGSQSLHPVIHAEDATEVGRRASAALRALATGDSCATELDPTSRLRYIAYQAIARELRSTTGRLAAPLSRELPRALRDRTHLMVRSGISPGEHMPGQPPREVDLPFEQEYYLSVAEVRGDAPELGETLAIRSVSAEISWFVRVANRVWPRLLEGARVTLDG